LTLNRRNRVRGKDIVILPSCHSFALFVIPAQAGIQSFYRNQISKIKEQNYGMPSASSSIRPLTFVRGDGFQYRLAKPKIVILSEAKNLLLV